MLIVIILIALTICCITGAVLSNIFCWDEEPCAIFTGAAIVLGVAVLICGGVCICINACPEANIIEWEEHVEYLQNEKEMLESVRPIITPDGEITGFTSDIYLHFDNTVEYYNAVNEYNKKVESFTVKIKKGAKLRDNLWISWFCSKAYTMFDQSKLENLKYSKGK